MISLICIVVLVVFIGLLVKRMVRHEKYLDLTIDNVDKIIREVKKIDSKVGIVDGVLDIFEEFLTDERKKQAYTKATIKALIEYLKIEFATVEAKKVVFRKRSKV